MPQRLTALPNAAPFPRRIRSRRFSLTPCRCSAEPERSSAAQRHAFPAPRPQPGGSLSRHADALPSRSAAAPPNAMPFPARRIRSPAVLSHAMPTLCRAGAPCSAHRSVSAPPNAAPFPRTPQPAAVFSLTPCRCSAEPERLAAFQRRSIPRRIRSPAVLSHAMRCSADPQRSSAAQCRAVPPPHPQPGGSLSRHADALPSRSALQRASQRFSAAQYPAASAARRFSLTPCRCSAEPQRLTAFQRRSMPRRFPAPQPAGSLSRHADALPSRSAAAPPNAMPFPARRIRSPAVLSHAMPTLCRTAAQQRRPMPRRFPRRTRSPAVLSHAMPMRRHSR